MKLLAKLKDTEYDFEYIDHTRSVARAILLDKKNRVCLLKILCDDCYGHREHLETPGGGVWEGETPREAVLRELREETGYIAEITAEIGIVDDYLNKIHRHNINHYFLCRIVGTCETALEASETGVINGTDFYTFDEAKRLYKEYAKGGYNTLVYNREYPVISEAEQIVEAIKNK